MSMYFQSPQNASGSPMQPRYRYAQVMFVPKGSTGSMLTRNSVRGEGPSVSRAVQALTPSSGLADGALPIPANSRNVACQSIT